MSYIRSFNRFELKYIIPVELIPTLQENFSQYMIPDEHADDSWGYAITSLYYDADDFRCYREKVEWLKYRRKLRIRYYETEKELKSHDTVFVEIKQRVDRVTQKRRVAMTWEDAQNLCNNWIMPPEYKPRDEATIHEISQFVYEYQLQPTIVVSYFRQAWMWTDYDPWLRITFDTNIRDRRQDLDLGSKKIGQVMLPLDESIMEIKANEHVPFWVIELISKYELRLVRVSKYCQGLETAELVEKSVYHRY